MLAAAARCRSPSYYVSGSVAGPRPGLGGQITTELPGPGDSARSRFKLAAGPRLPWPAGRGWVCRPGRCRGHDTLIRLGPGPARSQRAKYFFIIY